MTSSISGIARTGSSVQPESTTERGNLVILGLGLWVFVLSLTLVVASALNLHNERRDLLAEADGVALAIAESISDRAYYTSQTYEYDESELRDTAEQMLTGTRFADAVIGVEVIGTTVAVTLQTSSPLVFVPSLVDASPHVVIRATSYASLETI